jgi:hypothetical protein
VQYSNNKKKVWRKEQLKKSSKKKMREWNEECEEKETNKCRMWKRMWVWEGNSKFKIE